MDRHAGLLSGKICQSNAEKSSLPKKQYSGLFCVCLAWAIKIKKPLIAICRWFIFKLPRMNKARSSKECLIIVIYIKNTTDEGKGSCCLS